MCEQYTRIVQFCFGICTRAQMCVYLYTFFSLFHQKRLAPERERVAYRYTRGWRCTRGTRIQGTVRVFSPNYDGPVMVRQTSNSDISVYKSGSEHAAPGHVFMHSQAEPCQTGGAPFFVSQNQSNMHPNDPDLLTVREFSRRAKMAPATVYRILDRIPHVRFGRTVRIHPDALRPPTARSESGQPLAVAA